MIHPYVHKCVLALRMTWYRCVPNIMFPYETIIDELNAHNFIRGRLGNSSIEDFYVTIDNNNNDINDIRYIPSGVTKVVIRKFFGCCKIPSIYPVSVTELYISLSIGCDNVNTIDYLPPNLRYIYLDYRDKNRGYTFISTTRMGQGSAFQTVIKKFNIKNKLKEFLE